MKKWTIMLLSLLVLGCASVEFNPEKYHSYTAKKLLSIANQQMEKKEYLEAIKHYEALDALYPFEAETKSGQLGIIKAYYLEKNYESAVVAANRFLRLYPDDVALDEVYYYRGLAQMDKGRSFGQRLFHSDLSKVDLDGFRQAFRSLSFLLSRYPKSALAKDAKQRICYIRDILAEKELKVAKFYFDHKAYIAVIGRIQVLLKEYDGARQTEEGLKLMIEAYQNLGLQRQAALIQKLLEINFPQKIGK